jgi:asparagine synthetase B (glutamine-hydrolysing)
MCGILLVAEQEGSQAGPDQPQWEAFRAALTARGPDHVGTVQVRIRHVCCNVGLLPGRRRAD